MISLLRLLGFAYEHFRGSFFQGNALLMHFLLGPRVAPINKVQMKPGFVIFFFFDRCYAGWKMHHVCSLSKNVESQEV